VGRSADPHLQTEGAARVSVARASALLLMGGAAYRGASHPAPTGFLHFIACYSQDVALGWNITPVQG